MKLESRFERRREIGSAKGWSVRREFAWGGERLCMNLVY